MARLIMKSLVVLVLMIGIGNYLVYLKTGQMPLRDMHARMGDDWLADLRELLSDKLSPNQLAADAKEAMESVSDKVSKPETPAPTKVYKWTDANGQVHFGDKPLASDAEQIEVDTRNAISAPESSGWSKPEPTSEQVATDTSSPLEKARAAAEAMKQRVQQQEQAQ